jgi:putative RNA 2'-phosphotransferase
VDPRRVVKVSKYLSRHLRHDPGRLGVELDPGGWVGVDELLAACAARGVALSRAELEEVVARNDKSRFAFDPAGTRIRASQGHSVPVDLGLEPVAPPPRPFHGTGEGRVDAILRDGLRPMGRHHVHLSPDAATARRVGARHGRPVVLEVAAADLAGAGHVFLRSDNGVWLTDAVPPGALRVVDGLCDRNG